MSMTRHLSRISTPAPSHSFSSMAMISRELLTQKIWPASFFVIPDPVLLNKRQDVSGREAGQGGLAEMGVLGTVVAGGHVEVREIAPPAAGDGYLGAGPAGMVQHEHRAAPLSAFDGAQEARCSGADDDDVPFNQSLPKMETKFSHEGSKAQSLMNAKCRVQNGKVKIEGYEIMA